MNKKRYQQKLNPLYWLIMGLANSLRILTWLPMKTQLRLGKKLGKTLMKHSSKMQKVAHKNIEYCFPELSLKDQETLLARNFENVGIGVFESLNAAFASEKNLKKMLKSIEGLDYLTSAYEQNQSIILLFPHMIPMYLMGRLLALKTHIPMSLMYHSPKNPALDDFIYNQLVPRTDGVYNRKDTRKMVKKLKEGKKCVWYAPDLDIGRKQSEFIPFFGHQAATVTAPIKMITLTGAKLMPIGFYRVGDWQYHIKIYPPMDHCPSPSITDDLTEINRIVEDIIRQKPDQYLWPYKRFNTRPLGEGKIYR